MSGFFNRDLTPREVAYFYVLAIALFIFPIIQVDALYYDDHQRALLSNQESWRNEGRVLIEVIYHLLSFTSTTPNVFPLGYVFSLPLAALALRALTAHFGLRPRFVDCLVLLPLFYSPFSLGIFVYQYDGPVVMAGIAAVAYSVVHGSGGRWSGLLFAAVLVVVGIAINQLMLNILLGLYCIELAESISRGASLGDVLKKLARRAVQVAVALMIYGVTVFPLMSDERTPVLPFDGHWWGEVIARFGLVFDKLALLVTSGNQWMFGVLLVCAAGGYAMGGATVMARRILARHKVALLGIYIVVAPLLVITIPGFTVMLLYFDPAARVLLGVASALTALMFFSHRFLRQVDERALWLLAVPVLFMLSFSFMFGRVLLTQKALEDSVLYSLAYDLNSNAELMRLKDIYLVQPEHARQWLPASAGVLGEVPALNYVLNRNRLFMSEQFPRAGFTNVRDMQSTVFNQLPGKQLMKSNRFYEIYQAGDDGYIQMKNVSITAN